MTEEMLHRLVARYLDMVLPKTLWTTFPAGGGGKVRGGKLKGMGLKPGWPDIQIVHKGRYHGIELKTKNGKVSPDQKARISQIIKDGGKAEVCRSLEDVQAALDGWGIKTVATVSVAEKPKRKGGLSKMLAILL